MKILRTPISKHRSISIISLTGFALLIFVFHLSNTFRSTSNTVQAIDFKIRSFAKKLRVIDHNIDQQMIRLTFKNDYDKSITGFNVAVGAMRIQTELIVGGDENEFILPGAIYEKVYAIQEDLNEQGVTIGGVILDDGTSDGDKKFIQEMKDYRQGMRIERQRFLKRLQDTMKFPDVSISTALEQLESEISLSLPGSTQNSKLDNIGLGIRNERRRIVNEIKDIRKKQYEYLQSNQYAKEARYNLVYLKNLSENIIRLASS